MTQPPSPVTRVSVVTWRDAASQTERALPEEVAVAMTYDRVTFAVMMASPVDLHDFAVGFSLSEGIIESPSDIMASRFASCRTGHGMPHGADAWPSGKRWKQGGGALQGLSAAACAGWIA